MEFIVKRLDLLKALQSLQTQAASRDLLVYLSDVRLQAVDGGGIELSASEILGDTKLTIQARVKQSGAVLLPVKHFSEILQKARSETAHFTMAPGGQTQIRCGERTYHLAGTSRASVSLAPHLAPLAQKPRKMTVPLAISIFLHLIFALIVALTIKEQIVVEESALTVEWVKPSSPSVHRLNKPLMDRVQPKMTLHKSMKPGDQPRLQISAPTQLAETARQSLKPIRRDVDLSEKVPDTDAESVTTDADVPASPGDLVVSPPMGSPRNIQSGEGVLTDRFRAPSRGKSQSSAITSMVESTNAVDSADLSSARFRNLIMVPENKLGAILVGEGADIQGHIRLIRLKHSLSDWWQDPTAIPSFIKWLEENTRIRADMKFEGGALRMTDPRILDAPLVLMTGHDKDITVGRNLVKDGPLTDSFSPEERAALRKYIVERGGMLFFDDCGFNGLFAAQVADELQQVFPEYPLENIPHSHELYRIYYQLPIPPTGGDVFWGSENNPKASKFKYQKGITIGDRLAVVYNRKDYMCAMETAEIPSRTMLRLRRSTDVHRFMTNLLFYAMKYGGNTDRSNYTP